MYSSLTTDKDYEYCVCFLLLFRSPQRWLIMSALLW